MKFSIITPVFNRAKTISRCIQSVLSQTYQNWELLIIDDGSKDETAIEVRRFNDIRIKYFYQENSERSIARNNGIEKASGDYICFLDSDDEYMPNHLESLFDEIISNQNQKALFYTLYIKKTETDVILSKPGTYMSKIEQVYLKYSLTINTLCIHKHILEKEKFNPKLNIQEDADLLLRVALNYPVIQINKHTTVYNVTSHVTYNLKTLMDTKKSWEFFFETHYDILPSAFLKRKLGMSYLGLADYHFINKNKWEAKKYLLLAFKVWKPFLLNRMFLIVLMKIFLK
jgi:glycosyltransferase involved in cell wall biosynthesis